jgi:hypothetical protein
MTSDAVPILAFDVDSWELRHSWPVPGPVIDSTLDAEGVLLRTSEGSYRIR